MLRRMDELRFACTACGKCCTEPPEMTVLEATRLGDVFVPALVYRITSIPRDDNEAALASLKPHPHFKGVEGRELVARLRESSSVRSAGAVVHDAGWDHHISITARPWTYETKRCPALAADQKQCTIHERRPHTCRTVPIRYDVPAGLLVRAFRGVVDAGRASSDPFECDVSESAPVLLRDGEVVDESYAAARKAGDEAAVAERDLAARVLQYPIMPPLKEIYPLLRQNKLVSISFHGALAAAHDLELIDDAGVKAFCAAQLALIDREIATALARKRKEDRETTSRFRTLREAYATMSSRLA
jgi:Fe-S-cluster containining protein